MRQKVSVILPTYNRAELLLRAIESVLEQTYEEFELLVIDDGSTDNTREMVEGVKDPRIQYIRLEKNSGPAHARNIGIANAKYDYIAFHDSDDRWRKEKLEKQMDRLELDSNRIGLVYGCCEYNGLLQQKGYIPRQEIELEKKRGFIYPHLLEENLIGMPSLLVRRECIEKVGGFNENFPSLEDYEWILRLSSLYEVEYVDEVLVDVYATEGSVNQNLSTNFSARCMLIGMYKEEMARYGVLDMVVQEFLKEAKHLGCMEQVVEALRQVLGN